MYSFKQYALNEMAEEISLFQKLRSKIVSAATVKNVKTACDIFYEYQKKYGDEELSAKLEKLRNDNCDKSDAEFLIQKTRHDLIELYNWYNNSRRKAPKDISESITNIDEQSMSGLHIRDKLKNSQDYYNAAENIEANYPGVNSFLYAASKWAHEVTPHKDKELYTLLYSLRDVKHLQNFTDSELRKIYKYIKNKGAYSADGYERIFINASVDREADANGYDVITNFGHFTYKGIDVKNMEKKDDILKKLWEIMTSPKTVSSMILAIQLLKGLAILTGHNNIYDMLKTLKHTVDDIKKDGFSPESMQTIKDIFKRIFKITKEIEYSQVLIGMKKGGSWTKNPEGGYDDYSDNYTPPDIS